MDAAGVTAGGLHSRRSSGELKSLRFFESWTEDELEHFERIAGRVSFAAGEVMIEEGLSGVAFLVLLAGEADVIRGGEVVRRLAAGDHAGELALLDGSPTAATVVARTPVEAVAVYKRDFHNLLETLPSLARCILISLTGWFREASSRP